MALGGVLLGYFNAQMVFTADVISFIISILLILSIRYKETITAHLQQSSSLSIFKEGLKYISDNKVLRLIILITILSSAVVCPLDSLQMPMVAEVFHREADYLSVLSVCVSIGTLLGGAFYTPIKKMIDQKILFTVAFFYIGMIYAIYSALGEAVVPLVSMLTGVLITFLEIPVLFAGVSVLIFLVLAILVVKYVHIPLQREANSA